MKVTFNLSDEFLRQFKRLAKKYPSLVNDYDTFKKELCKNPTCADGSKPRWVYAAPKDYEIPTGQFEKVRPALEKTLKVSPVNSG